MTTIVGASITAKLFTARGHKQVMNELNLETMNVIRDQFWPFHFMTDAYSRYGSVFVKRSARWQRLKARVVHHQRPNEFTGELRRAVLADSVIRSTATRGTLVAKAPLTSKLLAGKAAGKATRRPLTDQRRKELETVSPDEQQLLIERQQSRYVEMASDPRFIDVVRVRAAKS